MGPAIEKRGKRLKREGAEKLLADVVAGKKWAYVKKTYGVSWKTYKRYLGLAQRGGTIARLGRRSSIAMRGFPLQVFTEVARVLCVPAENLVTFLDTIFPGMDTAKHWSGSKVQRNAIAGHRSASKSRYRQMVREIFGAPYRRRKCMDERVWAKACETAKQTILHWAPGNIGVHAVEVQWQPKGPKGTPPEKMMVGVAVDRGLYADRYFSIFQIGKELDDAAVANGVRTLLDWMRDEGHPVGQIMLVSDAEKGGNPTAIVDRKAFKAALGHTVTVQVDRLRSTGAGPIAIEGKYFTADDAFEAIRGKIEEKMNPPSKEKLSEASTGDAQIEPAQADEAIGLQEGEVNHAGENGSGANWKEGKVILLPKVRRELHTMLKAHADREGVSIKGVLEKCIEQYRPPKNQKGDRKKTARSRMAGHLR